MACNPQLIGDEMKKEKLTVPDENEDRELTDEQERILEDISEIDDDLSAAIMEALSLGLTNQEILENISTRFFGEEDEKK
jgi:hypothetical protein